MPLNEVLSVVGTSAAVAVTAYDITQTKQFSWLRRLGRCYLGDHWSEVVTCHYCCSHHAAWFLLLAQDPRLVLRPAEFLVRWLLVTLAAQPLMVLIEWTVGFVGNRENLADLLPH